MGADKSGPGREGGVGGWVGGCKERKGGRGQWVDAERVKD